MPSLLAAVSRTSLVLALTALAPALTTQQALAQGTDDFPLQHITLPLRFDSGLVQNSTDKRGVAYSAVISARGRPWLRLEFDTATFGRTPVGGESTVLRLTSMLDGGVQIMNASHLQEWRNSSAYFNGDSVRLEIICDPDAPASRIVMSHLITGNFIPWNEGGIATICDGVDDRVLSSEPHNARLLPSGCTAWIISDPNRTFLTAGHCGASGSSVIQFNVPLSTGSGGLVNPPPQHQYSIDATSIQSTNSGIGNDWCYFGCFPNSNTNLTPFQAQGQFYTIGNAPPLGSPAQQIRITGYGTTSAPVSPTWNQVQKTHTGPFFSLTGTTVAYRTDTTGGNSGSPVFNMDTNTAIGIHTNGGCTASGGSNTGTAIQNAGLQNALANPQGVCIPDPAIDFTYPDGLPTNVHPSGDSIRVQVSPGNGGTPQPGTGQLHIDTGSGFTTVAMTEVSSNVYDAVIPPTTCATNPRYYFSAQTTDAQTINDPLNAPTTSFSTLSAVSVTVHFSDNFQTNQGWAVTNTATDGFWTRVVPNLTCANSPHADADGSGMCYVTDNGSTGAPTCGSSDVDGGSTVLTSPVMNAVAGSTLAYSRWFATTTAGVDVLLVQVSDDNGASWVTLESHNGTGLAWVPREWQIDQIPGIKPSNQFRVRFTATDVGTASTVEAGIDGVRIRTLECNGGNPCPANIVTTGTSANQVDTDDLLAVITLWGPCPAPPTACPANVVNTGASANQVDTDDMLAVITGWGPCP